MNPFGCFFKVSDFPEVLNVLWTMGVLTLFPILIYFVGTLFFFRSIKNWRRIEYFERYYGGYDGETLVEKTYRCFMIGLLYLPFGILLYIISLPVSLAAFLFNLYRLLIDILRLVGHGMFCCFI